MNICGQWKKRKKMNDKERKEMIMRDLMMAGKIKLTMDMYPYSVLLSYAAHW